MTIVSGLRVPLAISLACEIAQLGPARAALASICSMTFLPSTVSLGSSIGYLPSKQAAQSREAGCSVAATKPRSEM